MKIRDALDRWLPTRAEISIFGLGSLLPWLVLAIGRVIVTWPTLALEGLTEALPIQVGEWNFWTGWGWGWWLGYRLIGRILPRVTTWTFRLLSTTLCLFATLELVYYQTTGDRLDLDVLSYVLGDVRRIWPVLLSELSLGRGLALWAVAMFCLLPAFRRVPTAPGRWRNALWLLCLGSALLTEVTGRPKPVSEIKTLADGIVENLVFDGIDRYYEVVIPPDPDALDGVEVVVRPELLRPNIVIVLLESVGAHATTPYTPTLQTTPNLARLAANGLLVRNLTTVVPHTSKALVATLCGEVPYLRAKVRESRPGGLPGPCLPELLAQVGYRSAFFQTARGDFENRTGLVHNMGFDRFWGRSVLERAGFEANSYFGVDDRAMLEPGLAWSLSQPEQPFFAVYLTLTSHHDYVVPSHWPTTDWPGETGRKAKYLASVNYVDDFLGRLVDAYEEAGLMQDTVFVILGDHGEGMGEHGRWQHDQVIYEEGLRIPGVIYGPDVLAMTGVIEGHHQQLDVLPTVLDLAGLDPVPGTLPGRSLFLAPEDRVLYHSCWRGPRCLARREGEQKFIDLYRDGPLRVYNLEADPNEAAHVTETVDRLTLQDLQTDTRDWRARVLGRYEAIDERWRLAVQSPDTSPAAATWDGRLSMLSCELAPIEVLPGESFWIPCRWRAEIPMDEAVRARVAVRVGALVQEEIWEPGDGELPVWEWAPDHAIAEDVRATVPLSAPPGPASVTLTWERYGGDPLGREPLVVELGAVNVGLLPATRPGPSLSLPPARERRASP